MYPIGKNVFKYVWLLNLSTSCFAWKKILMEKRYAIHLVIEEKACDIVKGKDHSQVEKNITEAGCKEDVRFKVSFRDRH